VITAEFTEAEKAAEIARMNAEAEGNPGKHRYTEYRCPKCRLTEPYSSHINQLPAAREHPDNPNRPTKEYWKKTFPAVKKSLQKYGWKGRGAKTLDEAAGAVTADLWYHKMTPGTKSYYEYLRKRREGK
jgi:hypothetical protein